jgi:hypothetical protein
MGYWSSSSITVYGDAYVDFNEEVRDRKEDVIKLFTDEELNEEIKKREDGRSKYENRINKLKTYVYNIDVDVNSDDVLDEVDNDDLITEVQTRGLSVVEVVDIDKYKLRKAICKALDINEMYEDEEIFEMLKEIWMYRR